VTTAALLSLRLRLLPGLAACICLAVGCTPGKVPPPTPSPAADDYAAPLASQVPAPPTTAGIVFSGTVLAVEHVPATAPDGLATVRVSFRVDEAVRGAVAGQVLTISEWQGLWESGQRYRVGQRVVLSLYPPSRELGLTSPVGGDAGRIVVRRQGTPLQTKQQHPPGATRPALQE
jgi:hypothetical protein